jgi:hypothetical protein
VVLKYPKKDNKPLSEMMQEIRFKRPWPLINVKKTGEERFPSFLLTFPLSDSNYSLRRVDLPDRQWCRRSQPRRHDRLRACHDQFAVRTSFYRTRILRQWGNATTGCHLTKLLI